MKNYDVYFEFFGRKMKIKILAESEEQAKKKVAEKISFHKVELTPRDVFNETDDIINSFMGYLKNKK